MKKVLITGGAGFLGYHLAHRLSRESVQIHLLDNLSRGKLDHDLTRLLKSSSVTLFQQDLADPQIVHRISDDYDTIFHLSAIVGVSNVLKYPYTVLEKNLSLLLNALSIAKKQNSLKRFVFASTSEVYAGTLQKGKLPIPTPEEVTLTLPDLKHPRTSYLLSKIYGEALCLQSGLPVTIIRPHNIFGPRMGMAHVIPELLKKAHHLKAGQPLPVYSVDHKRTFCFVRDAVEMMIRGASRPQCEGEILNIGCETPEIHMGHLAEKILTTTNTEAIIQPLPVTPGSPLRRCPDMTKTTQLTQYRPQVDLEEALRITYEWYQDQDSFI